MPQEVDSGRSVLRWTYAADGQTAARRLDDGEAVLTGGVLSSRPESPASRPKAPDRRMATLRFTVRTDQFDCDFEVERQNVVTVDTLTETKSYFHIVWKIDYPRMVVSADGASMQPVDSLSCEQWMELDMLLLGLLRDWPARDDEVQWLDESGRNDRVIFALGGWVGCGWDERLVRTSDTAWNLPSAVRFRRQSGRSAESLQAFANCWERVAGLPRIVNTNTGWTLSFDRRIDVPLYQRSLAIFILEGGGHKVPLPTVVPERQFDPPVWKVNLAHAMLMADGWSLERILGARSDEDWRVLGQALEEAAPRRPIELASLVSGVLDALLHWHSIEDFGLMRPDGVALSAITDKGAYWPFHHVTAAPNSDHFFFSP